VGPGFQPAAGFLAGAVVAIRRSVFHACHAGRKPGGRLKAWPHYAQMCAICLENCYGSAFMSHTPALLEARIALASLGYDELVCLEP
jgi:hypothetical protein